MYGFVHVNRTNVQSIPQKHNHRGMAEQVFFGWSVIYDVPFGHLIDFNEIMTMILRLLWPPSKSNGIELNWMHLWNLYVCYFVIAVCKHTRTHIISLSHFSSLSHSLYLPLPLWHKTHTHTHTYTTHTLMLSSPKQVTNGSAGVTIHWVWPVNLLKWHSNSIRFGISARLYCTRIICFQRM